MARGEILVVNSGSSSVRLAAFDAADRRTWSARLEGIGLPDAKLILEDEAGRSSVQAVDARDHTAALKIALETASHQGSDWIGVGHRIVHGGTEFESPQLVDAATEARLGALVPLAPLHMPQNLAGIAAARRMWPDAPQVACFDTAFHAALPGYARAIALPASLLGREVRRYGFHGLSYESIVHALKSDGVELEYERAVIAHLGAGASMCAVKQGKSVETTMGFSTLSGLPMGTRCGDVDPGALMYVLHERGLSAKELERALYERSGMLALSGLSGDMRELLSHSHEPEAAAAIEVFCYQARRQIGSLAAAMGGLDRLVFTGGIGANASAIRAQICAGLDFLGVELDALRNEDGKTRISRRRARVIVEARATDEESVIARHVRAVLDAA